MTKRCPGCGLKLQSENPLLLGYIPANTNNDALLCRRCFKVKHYSSALTVDSKPDANKILNSVNKKGKMVFFLIDFLNINSETINMYKKVKINKILVVSKADIIPREIKESRLITWFEHVYGVNNNIIFVSALKPNNIGKIPKMMDKLLLNSAYILGYTNSGKSSLINRIFKEFQNKNSMITVSSLPNTTLDFINMKINEKLTLIDSPGFIMNHNLYDNISLMNKLNPTKYVRPITYQSKLKTSILIEDIIRIEHLSDIKNSMTFYVSDKLSLSKVYDKNTFLIKKKSKEVHVPAESDLVIRGLGFINIKKECNIRIYSDYLELFEVRKSCF